MLAVFYDGKEEVILPIKTKAKANVFHKVETALRKYCDEILGVEYVGNNIRRVYGNEDHASTYSQEAGSVEGYEGRDGSSLIGSTRLQKEAIYELPIITIRKDGEEQEIPLGVRLYEAGIVLSVGKTSTNFMGVTHDSYFNKITRGSRAVRFYTSAKSAARVFTSLRQLADYLKKNASTFQSFAGQCGYVYQMEYTSDYYREYYMADRLSSKQKLATHEKHLLRVEAALSFINDVEPKEMVRQYGNTKKEEALLRMKELGIWSNVIDKFQRKEVIMISDVGGIFYDMDENGEKLIASVREAGGYPYLVVRRGGAYACLYVSDNKEYWKDERYDRREERILAAASMGYWGYDDFELGDIGLQTTAAGGVSRTA